MGSSVFVTSFNWFRNYSKLQLRCICVQPIIMFLLFLPALISAQQDSTSSILNVIISGLSIALRLWAIYKAAPAALVRESEW